MPRLIKFITPQGIKRSQEADLSIRIWSIFDPFFRAANYFFKKPPCLWRSLVLYRLLRSYGYNAVILIGVRQKDGVGIEGHSWIELKGAPFKERDGLVEKFVVMCRYGDN